MSVLPSNVLCPTTGSVSPYGGINEALRATGARTVEAIGDERLADGSYLSELLPTWHSRAMDYRPMRVRMIEYQLPGVKGAEPLYRLVTTTLNPRRAPASELAALY